MNFPDSESSIDTENYLKLKDRESMKGIFRGDPHPFQVHWVNQKSSLCHGKGCALCKENKPAFRFLINVIVNEGGTYKAKIWDQGWQVYKQLKSLNATLVANQCALEKVIVSISREGTGLETQYTVTTLPVNGLVTPALEAQLAQVKLFDLTQVLHPEEKEPMETSFSSDANEDIPF